MTRLIVSRILQAVPTLWVIATLTFYDPLCPGEPFDAERAIPRRDQGKTGKTFRIGSALVGSIHSLFAEPLTG